LRRKSIVQARAAGAHRHPYPRALPASKSQVGAGQDVTDHHAQFQIVNGATLDIVTVSGTEAVAIVTAIITTTSIIVVIIAVQADTTTTASHHRLPRDSITTRDDVD